MKDIVSTHYYYTKKAVTLKYFSIEFVLQSNLISWVQVHIYPMATESCLHYLIKFGAYDQPNKWWGAEKRHLVMNSVNMH